MIPTTLPGFDPLFTFLKAKGIFNLIIAGGAIRDTIFNKEIRDIDVYYTRTCNPSITLNFYKVEEASYPNSDFTLTHKIPYHHNGKELYVELIRINKPVYNWKDVLRTFPVSISQVALTSHSIILTTYPFDKAFSTHTIDYEDKVAHAAYYSKILQKYPDNNWSWHPCYDFISPLPTLDSPNKKSKIMTIKYKVLNHPERLERAFS